MPLVTVSLSWTKLTSIAYHTGSEQAWTIKERIVRLACPAPETPRRGAIHSVRNPHFYTTADKKRLCNVFRVHVYCMFVCIYVTYVAPSWNGTLKSKFDVLTGSAVYHGGH